MLLQVHPKDHLMDCDLHVVLDLQRGQQQVVAVLGEIIGCPAHLRIQIDDFVGHIAYVHALVLPLVEIIAVKVHGFPLIGKYHIDDKISQTFAVLIAHISLKIAHIQAVYIRADVVNGAVLLFQGLLHKVQQHGEDDIDLLVQLEKTILLPDGLLAAAREQKRICPHMLHPPGEML